MEGNVVGHGEDEERNTTVALSDAATVARTVATTAPPSLARMQTAATASVSLTMPKTTATRSTTAPTGVKAVGRSPPRRRGYPDGGDFCIVMLGAHDDGGDCVDVSHVASQKLIAVLEDVSVPTNSTVTLSGAAAVDAMAATCASPSIKGNTKFALGDSAAVARTVAKNAPLSYARTTTTPTASVLLTMPTTTAMSSTTARMGSESCRSQSSSPPRPPGWRRLLHRHARRARRRRRLHRRLSRSQPKTHRGP